MSSRRDLPEAVQAGADIVVYSATKHIDGKAGAGRAILCDEEFAAKLHPFLRHTGPTSAVQCLAAAERAGDAGSAGQAQSASRQRSLRSGAQDRIEGLRYRACPPSAA